MYLRACILGRVEGAWIWSERRGEKLFIIDRTLVQMFWTGGSNIFLTASTNYSLSSRQGLVLTKTYFLWSY